MSVTTLHKLFGYVIKYMYLYAIEAKIELHQSL